jgi:hypothetical protein
MESKAYYVKNILKTLGLCAIGLFLGKSVFSGMGLFEGSALLTALCFAGLPFGWNGTRDIFSGIHGMGWITMLLYYILRLGTSLAIGWAIMFYRLVKDLVQLIIVIGMERNNAQNRQPKSAE